MICLFIFPDSKDFEVWAPNANPQSKFKWKDPTGSCPLLLLSQPSSSISFFLFDFLHCRLTSPSTPLPFFPFLLHKGHLNLVVKTTVCVCASGRVQPRQFSSSRGFQLFALSVSRNSRARPHTRTCTHTSTVHIRNELTILFLIFAGFLDFVQLLSRLWHLFAEGRLRNRLHLSATLSLFPVVVCLFVGVCVSAQFYQSAFLFLLTRLTIAQHFVVIDQVERASSPRPLLSVSSHQFLIVIRSFSVHFRLFYKVNVGSEDTDGHSLTHPPNVIIK